jgi:SET domain-containing protein
MFRLDDDHVIDATICGGLARYVNHCCNPNCIAEIVNLEKERKIIIISNRRIAKGEEVRSEVTKAFPIEIKIQCFFLLIKAYL